MSDQIRKEQISTNETTKELKHPQISVMDNETSDEEIDIAFLPMETTSHSPLPPVLTPQKIHHTPENNAISPPMSPPQLTPEGSIIENTVFSSFQPSTNTSEGIDQADIAKSTSHLSSPRSRPTRTRKPVDRLSYDFLGQTKQHRAKSLMSDQEKLNAGRKLFQKWKEPSMANTRRKVYLRLLQEHSPT